MQPKLIIHGGAGSSLHSKGGLNAVRRSLHIIVDQTYNALLAGATAQEAVVLGCKLLEDDPRFNAGTGSVLQSDGHIRMSASLMNGTEQSLSGVINISHVKNPIDLAAYLQTSPDRILSDYGGSLLARELQLSLHNPLTDLRLSEWVEERKGNFTRTMAGVVAESNLDDMAKDAAKDILRKNAEGRRGTIGVVALDQEGQIVAGTSTGGKGFERVGRVSDSAMPAGTYATAEAGISCTGIGEDIIDECLAARIVVRVTDGLSIHDAFHRSFQEAKSRNRDFGAIGIDHTGTIAWGKNCDVLLSAYHNGDRIHDTLEAPSGCQVNELQL